MKISELLFEYDLKKIQQLAAVTQYSRAIQYIKNPTPRVQALAKQLGEQ
tara:strand:- start:30157 stop:30303 length:147 start_codon:yes stop_codon:yes gene_type:complete